jgi:succinate dehydrogenase hydrophobic anchor subunit
VGVFNNTRPKRKGFLLLTFTAVVLTALVGFFLMHRLQTESVQSIQHSIDSWQFSLTAIRWAVIVLITLFWNHLVGGLVKSVIIDEQQATGLTALRWRAVTWLVLLELIVGQGVLIKATTFISGAGQ